MKSEVIELKLMSLKTDDSVEKTYWGTRPKILTESQSPIERGKCPIAGLKTKSIIEPNNNKKHLKFDHMTYVAKNGLEVEAGDWR